MDNVLKFITKEDRLLNKLKPVTLERFDGDPDITQETVSMFNSNTIVELMVNSLMQEYFEDGEKEMHIESFFRFQGKLYEAACELLDACEINK